MDNPRKSLGTEVAIVDDGDSSGASSSEEEEEFGGPPDSTDLTWDLKRVIRSLRSGNQTATVISLWCVISHLNPNKNYFDV